MAIVLGLLLVVAVGAAAFYGLGPKKLAHRAEEYEVASYNEMKRRIRSGQVSVPVTSNEVPSQPPKPIEKVFELEESRAFLWGIWDFVTHKARVRGEASLNRHEAAVLYAKELEVEILNGGFAQYFFNSSGDHSAGAVAGLELIGASHMASILKRALTLFGEVGPSTDREARWGQTDKWSDQDKEVLGKLDDEFYTYPDPIDDLLAKHCREHRREFEP